MDTFKLCPLQDGYNFMAGNNVREQALEGGQPRQVIKFIGAVHRVGAQVMAKDPRERQYFWAFWRLNQTKQFLWNLALDDGDMEDCICQFSAEAVPQETLVGAFARRISFTVYVTPIARDADFDRTIVDIWNNVNFDSLIEIEKIPNVYFPYALGTNRFPVGYLPTNFYEINNIPNVYLPDALGD